MKGLYSYLGEAGLRVVTSFSRQTTEDAFDGPTDWALLPPLGTSPSPTAVDCPTRYDNRIVELYLGTYYTSPLGVYFLGSSTSGQSGRR